MNRKVDFNLLRIQNNTMAFTVNHVSCFMVKEEEKAAIKIQENLLLLATEIGRKRKLPKTF